MGESVIEEKIGKKILAIPGVELGYCARPGEVDLRIIGPRAALEQADKIVRAELGDVIFADDDKTLEEVLVRLLTEKKQTLATAESCTGGLLANRITNVAGASSVLLAGYVCYANEAKIDILGVDPKLIEQHGAVSEEVARAMAEGARKRAKIDLCAGDDGNCRSGRRFGGKTGGNGLRCARGRERDEGQEIIFSERPRNVQATRRAGRVRNVAAKVDLEIADIDRRADFGVIVKQFRAFD